jgi:hypothetical protein
LTSAWKGRNSLGLSKTTETLCYVFLYIFVSANAPVLRSKDTKTSKPLVFL